MCNAHPLIKLPEVHEHPLHGIFPMTPVPEMKGLGLGAIGALVVAMVNRAQTHADVV